VQSLEGATVQLASAQASPAHPSGQQRAAAADESEFVKVTENAYVTIRSLALQQQQQQPAGAPMEPQSLNRTIEVSFPSETSTLGTKWMNAEQKFTLHLQVSLAPDSQVQPDLKYPSDEAQQQQQQQLNSGKLSMSTGRTGRTSKTLVCPAHVTVSNVRPKLASGWESVGRERERGLPPARWTSKNWSQIEKPGRRLLPNGDTDRR